MTTEVQQTRNEPEDLIAPPQDENDLFDPYRSVSKAAVCSIALAVFGLLGIVFPMLLSAALLAIVLALLGLRNLRRYPNELTGKTAAVLGLIGGILVFSAGAVTHSYIYLTEVPDGYTRITFSELQPSSAGGASGGQMLLPSQLNGKRVFVKGYVHPGVSDLGEIRKFILVPDMGTCCFGGQPSLTDMIEVTVVGENGLKYSQRKRKLGGDFSVSGRVKQVVGGLDGGYYELKADYVK